MKIVFTLLVGLISLPIFAQQSYQTVRGTITEQGTGNAIMHAKIQCTCGNLFKTAYSDSTGNFRIDSVPVGRQSFAVVKEGYLDRMINHLDVGAGKELVLQIGMEEKIVYIKEAKINAQKDPKDRPLNSMATVSSRQFSVEETQRFAAAVNDPARMAMGFAGVMAPDDGNNMIVIRGNAPNGLIWRMEGMDIPNPNHFSNVGTSGGGITILSAQLLNNSDFFTGAFPAEYGNGLSGVFDLSLRKGNNEKKEHTIQFGLLGLDLATEGPLGKKGGSYLINYRYSTLSMISALGVQLGDAITKFQDLSYHVNLPLHAKANLSFFGFAGLSKQFSEATLDSTVWKLNSDKSTEWNFFANSIFNGAKLSLQAGAKHRIYIKTGLGMMLHGYDQKAFDNQYHSHVEYKEKYDQIKFTIAVQSQYKINSKIRLRSGLILNQQYFNLNQNIANKNKELVNYLSAKDNTQILQAYSQLQYRAGRKWTVNPGIHAVYLTLNKTASVEPRLGIKYQLGAKNWLSAGYGIHSQVQSLAAYTVKNTNGAMPNKNLKLSQAQHFILGYDRVFGKSWHVKLEGYFQQLYNLPVSPETGNTFGLVNSFEGYYQDTLVSKGKGQNKGVEITLEKFFTGSTYLLFTASLSDSKYTDGHGKEYSTRFDIGHTLSVSAGKEWRIHQNRLGLNTKIMWLGGMRETPIDVAASKLQETTVRDLTRTFEGQNPDYFRADIKISYKINKKRHSSTWSLDIQNSSNHKNIGGSYFDPKAGKLVYYTQAPLIPILAYKLEF